MRTPSGRHHEFASRCRTVRSARRQKRFRFAARCRRPARITSHSRRGEAGCVIPRSAFPGNLAPLCDRPGARLAVAFRGNQRDPAEPFRRQRDAALPSALERQRDADSRTPRARSRGEAASCGVPLDPIECDAVVAEQMAVLRFRDRGKGFADPRSTSGRAMPRQCAYRGPASGRRRDCGHRGARPARPPARAKVARRPRAPGAPAGCRASATIRLRRHSRSTPTRTVPPPGSSTSAPSAARARESDGHEVHLRRADEPGDEAVARRVVQRERCTRLLDPPAAKHDDPVGHRHRFHLVVRHVDHRRAQAPVQRDDLGAHRNPQLRIEIRQRLVEQEDPRLAHDRAPDRHALPLAAGELGRPPLEQLAEPQKPAASRTLRSISGFGVRMFSSPNAMFSCTVMCG